MKKLAIVFGILCLGVLTMLTEKDKKKKKPGKKQKSPAM